MCSLKKICTNLSGSRAPKQKISNWRYQAVLHCLKNYPNGSFKILFKIISVLFLFSVAETIGAEELKLNSRKFRYFRYFHCTFCNIWQRYGYFCHQWLKINVINVFFFGFRFLFLFCFNRFSMRFLVTILDRSCKQKTLVCNPILSNELKTNFF